MIVSAGPRREELNVKISVSAHGDIVMKRLSGGRVDIGSTAKLSGRGFGTMSQGREGGLESMLS